MFNFLLLAFGVVLTFADTYWNGRQLCPGGYTAKFVPTCILPTELSEEIRKEKCLEFCKEQERELHTGNNGCCFFRAQTSIGTCSYHDDSQRVFDFSTFHYARNIATTVTASPTPVQTTSPTHDNRMSWGNSLHSTEVLYSADGAYRLIMQDDGNAVVYEVGVSAVWASGTGKTSSERISMQNDCNLVVYTSLNTAAWSSGTGNAGDDCYLKLHNDGELVVYTASDTPVWTSKGNHVSYCANENSWCTCRGTVYYGRRFSDGVKSGTAATFDEMLQSSFSSQFNTGDIKCHNNHFNDGDPLSGYKKACWCLPSDAADTSNFRMASTQISSSDDSAEECVSPSTGLPCRPNRRLLFGGEVTDCIC